MTAPAPVALFVFRRPDKTRATLDALSRCRGIEASDLHVFCDGPRGPADEQPVAQVRDLVRRFDHPRKIVTEAATNQGLARSIIAGVTRLCGENGRVIVLEDDLIVSPAFLEYMNAALDAYAGAPRVMQVSGFTFARPGTSPDQPARFLPMTTSWGWATWDRAWRAFDADAGGAKALDGDLALRARFDLGGLWDYHAMLRRQRAGEVDSWAIRWYWTVFRRGGLVLYPPVSLVRNEGLDASGTHSSRSAMLWGRREERLPDRAPPQPSSVTEDRAALSELASVVDPLYLRRGRYALRRCAASLTQIISRPSTSPERM